MRTPVTFGADTAAAIEQLRRESGLGLSEAVSELVRRALMPRPHAQPFRQRTRPLRMKIDVSHLADALETLERETAPS